MSGGGVGLGDSLEMLNTGLAKRTCRADGRLLHLTYPLTVTPLQLVRMTEHCKVSLVLVVKIETLLKECIIN